MSANIQPIFCRQAKVEFAKLLTANTTRDGASGTIYYIFASDAANGGRVNKIVLQPLGSNVATVVRIFYNSGGLNTAPANNALIREILMPATTSTEAAILLATEVILDIVLPPNGKLFAVVGTGIAAGIMASAQGGDY